MKNLKSLLAAAAVAVAAISMAPQAQAAPGGQAWSNFTPNSFNSGVISSPTGSGSYSLNGPLNVNVVPFFYAAGNFGYNIDVQGWGAGTDARQTAFDIYHNQTFTTNYTGFANPKDSVSGQEIDTTLTQSANDANGNPYLGLSPIGPQPISDFENAGGTINPATDGGHMTVIFDYVMNIGAEDVAGTYSSTPNINFSF